MYTALVLTQSSRYDLIAKLSQFFDYGWEIQAHHLTLNMGPNKTGLPERWESVIKVVAISMSKQVCAVRCELQGRFRQQNFDWNGRVPHITLTVNRNKGGNPVMSNDLTWNNELELVPFDLVGKLTVID